MLGAGLMSYAKRSIEALNAGHTDFEGRAALAALGDTVGATNLLEGAQGRDVVTDRVLYSQERSERLGVGLGSGATAVFGSRFAGFGKTLGPRAASSLGYTPYSIPSISRPSYSNPIIYGKYTTPQGILLKGNIFAGARQGGSALLRTKSLAAAYRATIDAAGGSPHGGRFFHVLRHFHDQPGRVGPGGGPSPHGVFAPWYRRGVVFLLDSAYEGSSNPSGTAFGQVQVHSNRLQIAAWLEGQPIIGAQFGHPAAPRFGQPLDLYTVVIDQTTKQPVTMFPGPAE